MPTAYRYFEAPHQFSTYHEQPRLCELCGREGPGYTKPFYGRRDDVAFVCEDCLASGRLEADDLSTNAGDPATVRQQLRTLSTEELSEAEREQLVRERTATLEQRTPHVVTWQDFIWPVHCGDYCRYIKEVGQPELTQMAPDGDGVAFLAAHGRDIWDLDHAQEVWPGIRPDAPANGTVAYSVGVYWFRCLTCGESVLLWDCD